MRQKTFRAIGVLGTCFSVYVFLQAPSFPTPDKILVFATFLAMAFGQAKELLKRFVPFVVLLLVYESFRGLVPQLNMRVNYMFMPAADEFMFFGYLPTEILQDWWWHGQVMWYDFMFYGAYTLHFVLPFTLAAVVWKTKEEHYWRIITAYLLISFAGFLTYLAFPAAPPWLASDKGLIEPITRVSSHIFASVGVHDFPTVYNKISPNPVAAMPSLHAAYSVLFVLFVVRLFNSRWRWLAIVYPVLIMLGTVYMGEHYVIDALAGIFYAVFAYWASPHILGAIQASSKKLVTKFKSMLH